MVRHWIVMWVAIAVARPVAAAPAKSSIQGATQIFSTRWGLVAQGSGQLRTLAAGQTKWKTVHQIKGDSLYRVALDDNGRLMAWWEKEASFHLFDPAKKQHDTFALPKPPSPELEYGFGIEDMFFDGTSAVIYMHGFTGGRTWTTVAYRFDLTKRSAPPTLLFSQEGYGLYSTVGLAVFATPRNAKDGCEYNFCYPLGAVIAWEITGDHATKHVLLQPDAKSQLSRVRLIEGSDAKRVAILVDDHPRGRHILRWHVGDAKADFRPLPGDGDAERIRWMANGDLCEVWLTTERGLEIKRNTEKGAEAVTKLAPLPKRTPQDHPLFDVSASFERSDGALVLHWGEYFVTVSDKPSRLDLRTLFGAKTEIESRVIYVRDPEAFWLARSSGRTLDLRLYSVSDLERRAERQ